MADWPAKKDARYRINPDGASFVVGLLIRYFGLRGLSRESGVDTTALRKLDRKTAGGQAEAATVDGLARAAQKAVNLREYPGQPGFGRSAQRTLAQLLPWRFHGAFVPGPLVQYPASVIAPPRLLASQTIDADRREGHAHHAAIVKKHGLPPDRRGPVILSDHLRSQISGARFGQCRGQSGPRTREKSRFQRVSAFVPIGS